MQIVTDYRKALENAERFERAGDQTRADLANGLAKAIWAVMTTVEKWESIPNAVNRNEQTGPTWTT
jgi:hypothetical protein